MRRVKIDESVRSEMERLHRAGLSGKEIALCLGIAESSVWRVLTGGEHRENLREALFPQDVSFIHRLAAAGAAIPEISELLCLSGRAIYRCHYERKGGRDA